MRLCSILALGLRQGIFMNKRQLLKGEFEGEDGSFIFLLRNKLKWDWDAFYRLTDAMYHVADETCQSASVHKELAHGFWFVDTWVRDWTEHPDFPRPEKRAYAQALELIHDLCYLFFLGESPYEDDTLKKLSVRANS